MRKNAQKIMPSYSLDVVDDAGVRSLYFGSVWVQGAMQIDDPLALYIPYTQDVMLALAWRDMLAWPKKILQIGLGCGSIAKFLYHYVPNSIIKTIEIDPRMEQVAREHFCLPEDRQRLPVVVEDGAHFLALTRESFDLIIVDGFNDQAEPGQLEAASFYQNLARCVEDHGVVAINYLSSRLDVQHSLNRLRQIFNQRVVVLPANIDGNIVAFACHQPVDDWDRIEQRVKRVQQTTRLDMSDVLSRLWRVGR